MNRDGIATYLQRLGHRVIRTRSCYWYDLRTRFFLAFPHSQPVCPSPEEIRQVFAATRCVGMRFPAPPHAAGRASYAFIIDDRTYDLDHLSANTRSKVRRGLKQCEVRRLDPDFVRTHGRAAHIDSMQRMHIQRDVYDWARYWDAVESTPAAEVWGALRQGELLAYLVVVMVEGCAEVLVERSSSHGLRYYPNNALVFVTAQDLIRRPEVDRVLFGLESLESVFGVDRFKESMGFRRWPIRQRIVFHPLLEWVVRSPLFRRAVRGLARSRPQNEFWRKVEGLLIFHGSLEEAREAREASGS